jgi:hypothetical protein
MHMTHYHKGHEVKLFRAEPLHGNRLLYSAHLCIRQRDASYVQPIVGVAYVPNILCQNWSCTCAMCCELADLSHEFTSTLEHSVRDGELLWRHLDTGKPLYSCSEVILLHVLQWCEKACFSVQLHTVCVDMPVDDAKCAYKHPSSCTTCFVPGYDCSMCMQNRSRTFSSMAHQDMIFFGASQ